MVKKAYEKELDSILQNRGNLRRRDEEIEYWREHAGWFDDDARMSEYNNGVYGAYQGTDDDNGGGGGGSGGGSLVGGSREDLALSIFKVVAVVLVLGVSFCLSRAILKKSNKDIKRDRKVPESSRSSSRRHSRSRSRSRRGDYDLMDDDDGKSRRSSRSKSKRRSSRSRSRARSRSKSRRSSAHEEKAAPAEPVLV